MKEANELSNKISELGSEQDMEEILKTSTAKIAAKKEEHTTRTELFNSRVQSLKAILSQLEQLANNKKTSE